MGAGGMERPTAFCLSHTGLCRLGAGLGACAGGKEGRSSGLQPEDPEEEHANPDDGIGVSPEDKESRVMLRGGDCSAVLSDDVSCADDGETDEKTGLWRVESFVTHEEKQEKDEAGEDDSAIQRDRRVGGKGGDQAQREKASAQQSG